MITLTPGDTFILSKRKSASIKHCVPRGNPMLAGGGEERGREIVGETDGGLVTLCITVKQIQKREKEIR